MKTALTQNEREEMTAMHVKKKNQHSLRCDVIRCNCYTIPWNTDTCHVFQEIDDAVAMYIKPKKLHNKSEGIYSQLWVFLLTYYDSVFL